MINDITIDVDFEKQLKLLFGFKSSISKIIARDISAGNSLTVTIFFDRNKDLFAFAQSKSRRTTLSDIRKSLLRMNLKPKLYLPPKDQENYFDDLARRRFIAVFPGRRNIRSEELVHYRMLIPYNPALVQISEVRDGVIKSFDSDTHGNWKNAVRINYTAK